MLGKRVRVFWPVDNQWYVGIVKQYDQETGEHELCYPDGDTEWVKIGENGPTGPSSVNTNSGTPSRKQSTAHLLSQSQSQPQPQSQSQPQSQAQSRPTNHNHNHAGAMMQSHDAILTRKGIPQSSISDTPQPDTLTHSLSRTLSHSLSHTLSHTLSRNDSLDQSNSANGIAVAAGRGGQPGSLKLEHQNQYQQITGMQSFPPPRMAPFPSHQPSKLGYAHGHNPHGHSISSMGAMHAHAHPQPVFSNPYRGQSAHSLKVEGGSSVHGHYPHHHNPYASHHGYQPPGMNATAIRAGLADHNHNNHSGGRTMLVEPEKNAILGPGPTSATQQISPNGTGAVFVKRKSGPKTWTKEEDNMLLNMVQGMRMPMKWSLVAQSMPDRTGKQCRERYVNHLNPRLKSSDWSPAEDATIFHLYNTSGSQWAKMSKMIPGRTDNGIKNRFHNLRRQLEREDEHRVRLSKPQDFPDEIRLERLRIFPELLRGKSDKLWQMSDGIGVLAAQSVLGGSFARNAGRFGPFKVADDSGEQCARCGLFAPSVQCGNEICTKSRWCQACTRIPPHMSSNLLRECINLRRCQDADKLRVVESWNEEMQNITESKEEM